MQFCNMDISTTFTATSFKLGQLIKDNDRKKFKKVFSSYCSLQIWTLITCNKYNSKTITASSLKFGQLIEGDE